MGWFWDPYAPDHAQRAEITASPKQASLDQLTGLPPTGHHRRGRRPARRGRGVRRPAARRRGPGHGPARPGHHPRLRHAERAARDAGRVALPSARRPRSCGPPSARTRGDGVFDGFTEHEVPTGRGTVFARVGGSGPPLLLLHGYPQTHLMWHTAAPLLADRYTVVVADLPGYGASFRPVADAGPRRALETGARARPRGGDGRARPRPLRRRGARPGRAGGLPDGARPSRPRRPRRPCSTSCPPARCGPAPTPRWRSATGTGRSSRSPRRCPSG